MMELLEKSNLHWEALAIQMLFRYAGMGLNNFAMEQLVSNIPFGVIQKYRNHYPSLLALFAGVSGLNFNAFDTDNTQRFDALRRLHQLPVLEKEIWKKKGTRPASFPEKRITQMVQLLHKEPQFLSKIIALNNLKALQELLSTQNSSFSDTLLINVVIPLKFAYGKFEGKAHQEEIALSLLEELKAEQNSHIKFYKSLGITIENAKHSQAFLHLKKYYCSQKKCLSCLFSSHIFKRQS
jgi:hypothetical protein